MIAWPICRQLATILYRRLSRTFRRFQSPRPPPPRSESSLPSLSRLTWIDPPTHATLVGVEPVHVTLSGDLSGTMWSRTSRPDGRVLLRPDLSVKAMLARHGERRLTPEEFEQNFGQLPTDGEG